MNIFLLLSLCLRILSVGVMIARLCFKRTCKGLSRKTQTLFLLVFLCQLVLFIIPRRMHSFESSLIFLCFNALVLGQFIVLITFSYYRRTFDPTKDIIRIESLVGFVVMVYLLQFIGLPYEVLLHSQAFIDGIAALPQVCTTAITEEGRDGFLFAYFLLLAAYKLCYIVSMWITYGPTNSESSLQMVSLSVFQLLTYIFFFIVLRTPYDQIVEEHIFEEIAENSAPKRINSKKGKGRKHKILDNSSGKNDAVNHDNVGGSMADIGCDGNNSVHL
ncbi:hypothetical protein AAG570_005733 [Ranatra chinensis]|uniref:Uncharacterized protein n=1 Tax=Ranatra chinensis TaxID=642074 RepID=A0ABD0YB31_9HEMI